MKPTRCHILSFSPNGTTQAIASAIAAGTGIAPAEPVDLTVFDNRWVSRRFGTGDLVVLAFPVYAGQLPVVAREVFQRLTGGGAAAICAVSFGNGKVGGALPELNTYCVQAGFVVAGLGSFVANHCLIEDLGDGRPNETDLTQARRLGAEVVKKLRSLVGPADAAVAHTQVDLRRRRPKNLVIPATGEACMRCGLCVKQCPLRAINPHDPGQTDPYRCILCGRCVRICPQKAKAVTDPKRQAQAEVIRALNLKPKANQVWV